MYNLICYFFNGIGVDSWTVIISNDEGIWYYHVCRIWHLTWCVICIISTFLCHMKNENVYYVAVWFLLNYDVKFLNLKIQKACRYRDSHQNKYSEFWSFKWYVVCLKSLKKGFFLLQFVPSLHKYTLEWIKEYIALGEYTTIPPARSMRDQCLLTTHFHFLQNWQADTDIFRSSS